MATVGEVVIGSNHYMLAQDAQGKKAWKVMQLFYQPPSLIKEKIDLTILAAPQMRDDTGTVVTDRAIGTVIDELRVHADAVAAITITGLDDETYKVLFDKTATQVRSVLDPTGRITHYEIDLSCWGLYQPA